MPNGLLDQSPQNPMQQAMPQQQPENDMGGQPSQTPNQASQERRDYNKQPIGKEDEQQVRLFRANATKLIYSPKTKDKIVSMIDKNSSVNPVEQIANISLSIMDRIEGETKKKKAKPIDDFVKINGGVFVVEELINLLEASGKIPRMNDDEKALALSVATQKYTDRMLKNGEITKDELKKYTNQALSIANQNGTLNMDKLNGKPQGQQPPKQASEQPPEQAPTRGEDTPIKPKTTMSQQLRGGLLNG